ncbi:hypothetical protein KM043_010992 [Ampulex compressa]|nr:hypothetical protein KM043_010992 [Ampulex compressa]
MKNLELALLYHEWGISDVDTGTIGIPEYSGLANEPEMSPTPRPLPRSHLLELKSQTFTLAPSGMCTLENRDTSVSPSLDARCIQVEHSAAQ